MKISLKAARINAGATQTEAGKAIGVDRATISSWEKGKTAPRIDQMHSLCNFYMVNIDCIFLPAVQS